MMNDDEKVLYDEIERWLGEMQRPMLLLRAALVCARAGIDLPEGQTVRDELERVGDICLTLPVGALITPLSSAVTVAKMEDTGNLEI